VRNNPFGTVVLGLRGVKLILSLFTKIHAVSGNSVIVNNASVIQADIQASNGVIHAVNRVLLPEGLAETIQSRMSE